MIGTLLSVVLKLSVLGGSRNQLLNVNLFEAVGFTDLMFKPFQNSHQEQHRDLAMLLWCIWSRRNDKVWKGDEKDALTSIILARKTLLDWDSAKMRAENSRQNPQGSLPDKWKKPAEGTLTCNVAALFGEIGCYGVGMCVRNHSGEFIGAKTVLVPGRLPMVEAKARGLWEAISWVGGLGYHNVSFETDCKTIVDGILENTNCQTEAGSLLEAVKRD